MFYVEHFFHLKEVEHSLETSNTSPPVWSRRRRVFLASNDAAVFHEAKTQYSRYEFIGRLRNGSSINNRTSCQGVFDMTVNLHLLIAADFIVCTYNSNVCRLAYELLLMKSPTYFDAAFQSSPGSTQFINKRWWRAIADFEREGVKLGDQVSIESTKWDGFVQTEWKLNGARNITMLAYLLQEIFETIL
ncbi:unnamed protein product [Dibothriocephalus latus]|uniref:GT23 domain-containing protein n=1 Tax=Dibothriocephalus latus TaxID=60516 RepID=A0A3P7LF60_DIBLA|nr:unnamed protein product [Dibothriocephalus latus]